MKTPKQEVQAVLDTLPDDTPLQDIVRNLVLRARILHSRDQALRGELIPNEQVIEEMRQWRQSAGR